MHSLIPVPASQTSTDGNYTITNKSVIKINNNPDVIAIAKMFAGDIQKSSGVIIGVAKEGDLEFTLVDDSNLGDEGYLLSITSDGLTLRANQPAGLFYGTQTLRQLFNTPQNGTVSLPAVSITDSPRFTWRGAMLDVARHFFSVDDVKRYIDLISHYKMNRLAEMMTVMGTYHCFPIID